MNSEKTFLNDEKRAYLKRQLYREIDRVSDTRRKLASLALDMDDLIFRMEANFRELMGCSGGSRVLENLYGRFLEDSAAVSQSMQSLDKDFKQKIDGFEVQVRQLKRIDG